MIRAGKRLSRVNCIFFYCRVLVWLAARGYRNRTSAVNKSRHNVITPFAGCVLNRFIEIQLYLGTTYLPLSQPCREKYIVTDIKQDSITVAD